jgi:hypothetical protein
MRIVRGAVGAVLLAVALGAGHGGCGSPTTPPPPTTTTSTSTTTTTSSTTTTSTTSTTTSTTSTTTTTTTTTLPAGYAPVHPLWASRGCTACHITNTRLDLSGGSANTCTTVRNGSDRAGGQYLDNPLCSESSSIISVPASGRAGNGPHPGGTDNCFGASGSCRATILAWCSSGAACP